MYPSLNGSGDDGNINSLVFSIHDAEDKISKLSERQAVSEKSIDYISLSIEKIHKNLEKLLRRKVVVDWCIKVGWPTIIGIAWIIERHFSTIIKMLETLR